MAYAKGVNKIVSFGVETTYGTPSAAAGQQLRRVTSNFALNTSLIPSAEIIPSQQIRDARQGPRQVSGTLSGQLSSSTYKAFIAALLRGTFANVPSTGTLTDLTLASGGALPAGAYTIASVATNFGTGGTGLKLGDPVKFTGLGSTYAADNGIPTWITGISGTGPYDLTTYAGLGSPSLVTFGAAQSGAVAGVGTKLIIPSSNQLFPSFTVEDFYSDVSVSDIWLGCVPTQMQVQMPARGFCTFNMTFLGQNGTEGTSQLFTGAAAPTTTPALTMVGGSVLYSGGQIAYMASATLSLSAPAQADPMIGSNISPAVFLGPLSCTGSFNTLTKQDSMTTDFLNENEVSLLFIMASANNPQASFIAIYLPRVKIGAATKQDSPTAITRAYTFQALENTTVAAADDSTLIIYDSSLT